MQSALLYPGDFDGIVAGAPAVDWNHFIGSGGITTMYVGADSSSPDRYIPPALWNAVTREVYKQCDELDGLADGIISDPDTCDFNPDPLLCHHGGSKDCLTQAQIDGLHDLYKPIYGTKGDLLWPRFSPGSELDTLFQIPMVGKFSLSTVVSVPDAAHASDECFFFSLSYRSGSETQYIMILDTLLIILACQISSMRIQSILVALQHGMETCLNLEKEGERF
jgi:Tannase and feruloyl esterase